MIYISNKKLPNKFWQRVSNLFGNFEFRETDNIKIDKIDKTLYCGRPSILGNSFSHLNNSIASFICKKKKT